jgi:ElaB/YqjD/DUF883 family membrane-anchored ribosome-binding protein
MDSNKNRGERHRQEMPEESGSASVTAHHLIERGAKMYGQVEQAINDAYDKTRTYNSENPGKTILISLGIGVGLGLLLGVAVNTHRRRAIRGIGMHNTEKGKIG